MKGDNLTLITCSYNTPLITECMLKTYCKYHKGKHRIIIVENSDPGDATRGMLEKYNVPYVDGRKVISPEPAEHGWGWSHHRGLDWAVRNCSTPYCLIVDTDIIFKQNLQYLFDFFENNEQIAALGPHYQKTRPLKYDNFGTCMNPEQKHILPRVHPCFMMLDVELFKKHDDLTFNGSPETGPVLMAEKLAADESYDIGSYLFMRLGELGKQTSNVEHNVIYTHAEGASWAEGKHHILDFYTNVVYNELSDIDITNKFY